MRKKRRMSAAEFETVRPLLNISEDRIEAARMALVDGHILKVVGDQFKWTRQAVWDAADIVYKTLEKYRETQRAAAKASTLLPSGWEQVTIIAPTRTIANIRAEIEKDAQQLIQDKT